MDTALFRVLVLVMAAVAGGGCQRTAPPPPAMPMPQVTVAQPATFLVQSYYEYNGHLEAVETVEVKARVKGLLEEVHFVEGQEVERGIPLYTIDPREYRAAVARSTADLSRAAADIDSAQAQIKLAEAELRRSMRAAPSGAMSQSDVDRARATLDVNLAQLALARATKEGAEAALQTANIQLGYTDVRAPIAGRISRTLVTKGNLVGQDQPTLLTTIVSVDPLYVYFDAPERDLVEYLRAQRPAGSPSLADRETAVEVGVATEEGYPHPGAIDFRENRVDVGTGTIRLRGRVPNPQAQPNGARVLYPGLYARVRVPSGKPDQRPVIPEEALMTGQEGRFVYVLGPGDVVEKRPVVVGTRVWQARPAGAAGPPGWTLVRLNPPAAPVPDSKGGPPGPTRLPLHAVVAVNQGLEPADRVIVAGLQKARPGAPVAPDEWELRPPRTTETAR